MSHLRADLVPVLVQPLTDKRCRFHVVKFPLKMFPFWSCNLEYFCHQVSDVVGGWKNANFHLDIQQSGTTALVPFIHMDGVFHENGATCTINCCTIDVRLVVANCEASTVAVRGRIAKS